MRLTGFGQGAALGGSLGRRDRKTRFQGPWRVRSGIELAGRKIPGEGAAGIALEPGERDDFPDLVAIVFGG